MSPAKKRMLKEPESIPEVVIETPKVLGPEDMTCYLSDLDDEEIEKYYKPPSI